MVFRKGKTFSIPSMLARDCTKAMGIMKKKVRKKNAMPTTSFLIASETYGIARLSQYTSRGSGAHSVSQMVGFRDCCVCAQTAAAHRVLKETNAAGTIYLLLLIMFILSVDICHRSLRGADVLMQENVTSLMQQSHTPFLTHDMSRSSASGICNAAGIQSRNLKHLAVAGPTPDLSTGWIAWSRMMRCGTPRDAGISENMLPLAIIGVEMKS
nr:hypothetical protein Iba_chr03eCG8030 [Ipomoea batatas]